ncbi:MAG: DUF6048 family protein [Solirubrobacteraceae bacterium]
MKHILIYSFSFFLQFNFIFSQLNKEVNDSVKIKKKIQPLTIFIGLDLLSPLQVTFSKKKSFKGFVQIQTKKKWAYVIEGGIESNNFNKLNWNIDVNGFHSSLGFNYFLAIDKMENKFNGFYIGGRISNAYYNQEIKAYPIYGNNIAELVGIESLNKAKIISTWIDLVVGARVDFIKKKLYADLSIRPKFHLFSTKQEGIKPIIIPGFGVNQNNLNTDVLLALAYQINFNKTKQ